MLVFVIALVALAIIGFIDGLKVGLEKEDLWTPYGFYSFLKCLVIYIALRIAQNL